MQFSFYTDHNAQHFTQKVGGAFPPAPDKCPFKDCHHGRKLKKHGYYSRFFISKSFTGLIYIRRYICPICGRTVSMIPMFCLGRFQYSSIDILDTLHEYYDSGISLRKLVEKLKPRLPSIERRHLNYYRERIIKNRQLIQYGLNLISPEFILEGAIPENQIWVKAFLKKVHVLHPHVFVVDFSDITGKTFMTTHNMIA